MIIAGIAFIILSRSLKNEDNKNIKNRCLMYYFESDTFINIATIYGFLFIIIGGLNILVEETILELYLFIISIVTAGTFAISTLTGLWKYLKS